MQMSPMNTFSILDELLCTIIFIAFLLFAFFNIVDLSVYDSLHHCVSHAYVQMDLLR